MSDENKKSTTKKSDVTVTYIGTSDIRTISKSDLKKNDITVSKDLVWTKSERTMSGSDLTEKALEFLRSQPDFIVSES